MESEHGRHEDTEETGALNADDPEPPDEAGQKGAGSQTEGIGGERKTEPEENGRKRRGRGGPRASPRRPGS